MPNANYLRRNRKRKQQRERDAENYKKLNEDKRWLNNENINKQTRVD